MSFDGRAVVVTGAARGLGAVVARHVAAQGGHVVLADIADDEGAVMVDEIIGAGGAAEFRHLDVTDESSWRSMLDDLPACHVLVNNAGVGSGVGGGFDDVAGFDKLMSVNARGTFLGCAAGARAIQRCGGGSIVNVASVGAVLGSPAVNVGYGASKSAVQLMTRSFAVRYASDRVRVNCVLPGIMPPMRDSTIADPAVREAILARVPMGRAARLEEVANAVMFLASDMASYMTGTAIPIDGGWLAA